MAWQQVVVVDWGGFAGYGVVLEGEGGLVKRGLTGDYLKRFLGDGWAKVVDWVTFWAQIGLKCWIGLGIVMEQYLFLSGFGLLTQGPIL